MELTVITGMSGAGKSQAMGAFEDSGWFVVDNLPPRLLSSLAELFSQPGHEVVRAAAVCDIRGGEFFDDLGAEVARMEQVTGVRPRILFLEASDEVLLNRFRETRRRHPLAGDGPLVDGIRRERDMLADVRAHADVIIDTTGLNIWDLRRTIIESMIDDEARPRMQVLFTSFGFKHGAPGDADLLFDVRFIDNPHYVPEFAPKTGLDPDVSAFVFNAPQTAGFLPRLESLLDFLLPKYVEEGKSHLVVAFGCTGGRHRSVAMAEAMARRYRGRPDFQVAVTHRDISRATLQSPAATDASRRVG
ncbi:MAG: RNase adapter RapZ [Thermoleophilia bacterium]